MSSKKRKIDKIVFLHHLHQPRARHRVVSYTSPVYLSGDFPTVSFTSKACHQSLASAFTARSGRVSQETFLAGKQHGTSSVLVKHSATRIRCVIAYVNVAYVCCSSLATVDR